MRTPYTDLFTWAARYPDAPGSKRPGTSAEAAVAMKPRAETLRAKVLALIEGSPRTADECAEALRESALAIRPRLSELVARGRIVDSGERRLNGSGKRATVWRAA